MKKDTFLNLIQGEAHCPGKAQEAWGQAIKIDDEDPRWKLIYDESYSPVEVVRQFNKYFFGVEEVRKPRPKRRTQVERWTAEIEKIKTRMQINAHPSDERYLAETEAKLAHAIKNNL